MTIQFLRVGGGGGGGLRAEHVDIPVPFRSWRRRRASRFSPRTGLASSSMDRSYVGDGAFDRVSRTFPGVKKKCGVRQPVRRSPARFFSHLAGSSRTPAHGVQAACGDGQGDFFQDGDEEEEEEELEMFDESIDPV